MKLQFIAISIGILACLASCQDEDQINTTIPEGAIGYVDESGQAKVLESTQGLVQELSAKIGIEEAGQIVKESIHLEFNQEKGVGYLYFKRKTDQGTISSAIRVKQSSGFMLPIAEEHSCAGNPCEDCNFTYKEDGTIEGCKCADTTAAGNPKGFCNHTVSSGGF